MIVAPQIVQRDVDFVVGNIQSAGYEVPECYSALSLGIFDAAIIDLTVAEMSDADKRANGLLFMQVVTRRTDFDVSNSWVN